MRTYSNEQQTITFQCMATHIWIHLNGGMSDNNNVAFMCGIAALFILLTQIERKL